MHVDGTGHHLLPGTRLAPDQHCRPVLGQDPDHLEDFDHLRVTADHVPGSDLFDLVGQVGRIRLGRESPLRQGTPDRVFE